MNAWPDIERALDGILARRWYTNHGPLARRLEEGWKAASGRAHVVAATNATIAVMMVCDALRLTGTVTLSALAPSHCIQALSWAGLAADFADIDPATLTVPDRTAARTLLVTGGLGDSVPAASAPTVFADEVDVAGPVIVGLPGFGDDSGAACILCDDDEIAARLRNIRSSYGAGPPVPVVRTANGRLSEAQAAMALLHAPGLSQAALLRQELSRLVPDLRTIPYGRGHLVVAEHTDDRDQLCRRLLSAGFKVDRFRLPAAAAPCPVARSLEPRLLSVHAPEMQ